MTLVDAPSLIQPSCGVDGERFHRARKATLATVMLLYLFYYTGRQTFGFAIPGMMEELNLTKSQLGWCGALMLWSYALGQAVNGQLADRFGGRKMMTAGGILSVIFNWIVSFSSGVATIATPWAANGLAQSMGWAPGSRILSNWWDRQHRGIVYGSYVFAAGCASIIAFVMATWVVDFGWRWIFRLPVLLLLVASVIFWFFVRDKPTDCGLPDLPEQEIDEPEQTEDDRAETIRERYMVALKSIPFLFACASIGFQNLARYGLYVWVPVHFLGNDWKNSPDKWISVWLPVGMAVGALTNGWISDRLLGGNRSKAAILFLLGAAACGAGMWFLPPGHFLIVPLLFLTGFFVFGPESAYWALCPDLLGRRHAGTGTGVMNFSAKLFAGIGEPMIGSMVDLSGQTSVIFAVVAISCTLAAGLMAVVKH